MTCIIGLKDNGRIYMGGDSAGVAGFSLQIRADEKVFKKGEFIFGFTSSFRMGQLIRYKLSIPKLKEDQDIDDYLHNDFLDSLIKCFKDNGFAKVDNNVVLGGHFLMGFRGNLYHIQGDFQIAKCISNYNSVGCGEDIALGAMHVLDEFIMSPENRILRALEAAEKYSAGVRRPFHILSI